MEPITTPAPLYTPPASAILHHTSAGFQRRPLSAPVYLMQYDRTLPVLAVSLRTGENGELAYTVPADAAVNLRMEKADGHIVYNPALGLDSTRQVAYIGVTAQMTTCAGPGEASVEIVLGGGVAGTAPIALEITQNPVTEDAIESADEMINLRDFVSQAQASADAAKASEQKAAASAAEAKTSENRAKASENAAKASEKNAGASASAAAASQSAAASSASAAAAAKKSIEDMSVSANTLPPGSSATVQKTFAGENVHLRFGLPAGEQGAMGPQGAQGPPGPQGPRGIDGVAVSAQGLYAFNVNAAGHLILSYTGDTAPDFAINNNGHLILTI